jgi:hypothetical protein
MPQVPSKIWTPFDVLSSARELAKTTDQKKVVTEQGRYFYKLALTEVVTLLNSTADPSYHTSAPLTTDTDTEFLLGYLGGGTITGIDSTAKTITRITGSFVVGSHISVVMVLEVGGGITSQWTGRITIGGSVATYKLISGTDITYAPGTNHCAVSVQKTNLSNPFIADISEINYDRIVSIEDSSVGQCVPVTQEEFASLGRSDFKHISYADDIVWALFGNNIRFRNGSKVTPGTKTMWYQRQPNFPTAWDDTEFVDLADKWIPLLIRKIYTYILLQTEPDIPKNIAQEMQLDYQLITGFKQAEIENKTKDPKQVTFK